MNTRSRQLRLKRQILFGSTASVVLIAFYLVGQRTNWLAASPIVCGGWRENHFIKGKTYKSLKQQGARPYFCIREIIRPYSKSMADIWGGVSIYDERGETYVETQFFVAEGFGKEKFTDEPGDWMIHHHKRFNQLGIERESRSQQIASWFDPMMDRRTAYELWRTMKIDVSPRSSGRQISWVRQVNEQFPELALLGFSAFFCFGVYKRLYGTASQMRIGQCELRESRSSENLLAELALLIMLLLGWSVFRWTDWLSHTPFQCSTYRSRQLSPVSLTRVCFHEVLATPSQYNQTTVLGASIHTPQQVLRADIQFYIADGKNKLGFKDEPGDWAFLSSKHFHPGTGLLMASTNKTVSSWFDAGVPSDVQLQLWTDVRDKLVPRLKARRVSIPRKLSAVLESFAALAGASILAIMTFIKLVDLMVSDMDDN